MGEIAPCDHVVQIYENNLVFLNTLEGFARDGFIKNESVIIIATPEHILELNNRLKFNGFNVNALIASGQYITADAEESIEKFIVNGWPDEILFTNFVVDLMQQAQKRNQKVRAFGEMVALLWAKGNNGATVKLENLWHQIQQKSNFCLYCAYPKSGFTQDIKNSIKHICNEHSMVIDG